MPGTFVLALPLSGTPGAAGFTDLAGKSITVNGGATHVANALASDGVGLSVTSATMGLSIPLSPDFPLSGQFSIGLSFIPSEWASGTVINVSSAFYIARGSYGLVFDSSWGGADLGDFAPYDERTYILVTRDADNTVRFFRDGVIVDEWADMADPLGESYSQVRLGGSDYPTTGFRGVIDDVFIVTGAAVRTANYTPAPGLPSLDGGGGPEPYSVSLPLHVQIARRYSVPLPLHVQVAARYSVELPLQVAVSDARVFDSAIGAVSWSLRVVIGGVDYSARLCGLTSIDAGEDAARIAALDLLIESPAELSALDSAAIYIDVVISGGGYSAGRRRFTGVVEVQESFSPASRVVSLVCRDGYQERIKAAGSAAAVRSLLGDMVVLSDKITAWDDAEPDAVGYFQSALDTVPGATFIDGAGQWRVVRWDLSGPARTYGEGDMFDPGPVLSQPSRSDMPSAVVATLTHEFSRLHNVELALEWEGPPYADYVIKGVLHTPKSIVLDALNGLSDWEVRGNPVLVSPAPGSYPVWDGVQTVYYLVNYGSAEQLIDSMSANVYRRWYQTVSRRYTVTIDMGGSSDRDDSISRSIRSTFDAAGWESGKRAEPSLGIYRANPPPGAEDEEELTGYEALEAPWPPTNGAVDWPADIDNSALQQAVEQVVAEATRTAAQGRRRRRVTIERPVDLRLEIGDVNAFDALGVAGVGQIQSFSERYDHDSGECVGTYVFACPKGAGSTTGYTLSLTVPTADDVAHVLYGYPLGNHYGADTETPTDWVHPDSLAGYLCNTLPTSDHYVESKPTFEQQFRIVLPEIPAAIRDPLEQVVAVDASVDLADGALSIDF